ncbi:hypothetical protein ASC76_13965 [Rhizobacter sp. Root404]|nr:bifunctional diguanylate cyclase/phosphodiesterase [Rhizobacter sp. Root404]KQW39049.1 hypothetical protein ASC76_13965 [Rhizobacter sp. Root404]
MSFTPHPIRTESPEVVRRTPRHQGVARLVLLILAVTTLAAAVVLTLRQDRQAAIAQDQARAVKVAEGVQLFASEVIGQAVDSLRELRHALAARADDEADRSAARLIASASRHDPGSLALGLRSAPGTWLVAGRDGPLALESLVHAAGDTILRALAERLTQRFGSGGFIARLGGDQIALCVALPARENVIGTLCVDLYDTIAEPLTISGVSLTMTASLGSAVYPDDSTAPAELLRYAEMAMFEAKRELRPHERYSPALDRFSADSLALLRLRARVAAPCAVAGLSAEGGHGHRPPGRRRGARALEASGQGGRLAIRVRAPGGDDRTDPSVHRVRAALGAGTRPGLGRGGHCVPVAVNVSVNNLMDANFVALVRDLLAEHEVPPGKLELEVTESSLARNPELALMRLEELRRLGVCQLDRRLRHRLFLARVPEAPARRRAEARPLVHASAGDRRRRPRIVESTIRLGHGFGMKVVAEGVETAEIAGLLTRMGCDVSQGYFHARPMPPEELEAKWLARGGAS